MRKIRLLLLASALLSACSTSDEEMIYMHSYIWLYEDTPPTLWANKFEINSPKGLLYLYCTFIGEREISEYYTAPELGNSHGKDAERFLEIAERNGDRTYDRYVNIAVSAGATCYAHNFKSMHVRCLNAAWDDAHPAGATLDDRIRIHYISYADYVRRGYPKGEESAKGYEKRLHELNETDLSMFVSRIDLYFDSAPPAGSYEMEATFVTTEGEEKTAACMLIVE